MLDLVSSGGKVINCKQLNTLDLTPPLQIMLENLKRPSVLMKEKNNSGFKASVLFICYRQSEKHVEETWRVALRLLHL